MHGVVSQPALEPSVDKNRNKLRKTVNMSSEGKQKAQAGVYTVISADAGLNLSSVKSDKHSSLQAWKKLYFYHILISLFGF